jgi:putative DNA primase/helicase
MSGITAAALARVIEEHRPTILIDEYDAIARGNKEMAESLRGQLNSSFNRSGANVLKSVPLPGGGWEVRQFSTWAATCIAGIGRMSDTVEDRSVIIRLKRKLASETVKRLRRKDGGDLDCLKRQIARWVGDNQHHLRYFEPTIPSGIGDRAADKWDSLLTIAEIAGGDWPMRARAAALALDGADEVEVADSEKDVMLLADIRQIFEARNAARLKGGGGPIVGLTGEQLTNDLVLLVDRKWPTWNCGKPISPYQLASLLRPYGVKSRDVREGEDRFWGYRRDGFDDAFKRYLPSTIADARVSKPAHPTSVEKQGEVAGVENPTSGECRESKTTKNPSISAGCRVVGNPINATEGRTDAAHLEEASQATGSSEKREIQAGPGTMRAPSAARETPEQQAEGQTESDRDWRRWRL